MSEAFDRIAQRLERADLRIWAVAASLLLSVYAGFTVPVPNDDAFVYIRTAQLFQQDGIAAAFDHYAWAGYSVLIGLTAAAGLELFTAAYLLNGLFFSILTFAFVSICREFSQDRFLLALAALTILLFPEINEYRFQILRDSGFWAFVMLGMWWLIRYGAEGSWKFCLYYCGALLLAAIFRPEAMLYLLAAPLCLLFDRRHERAERYLLCFRVQGVAVAALLLCFLAGLAFNLDLFQQAAALASAYAPFLQSLFDPGGQEMAAMAEAIFGEHAATYSGRYLPFFLLAGLMVILAAELLYAVGMPFSLILIWGCWKKWLLPDRDMALPVIAFTVVNLLVVLAFLLVTRYLTSRYAMVFSLGLALAVPFTAREMLARIAPGTRLAAGNRLAPGLLVLFFVFSAVDSYYTFGRSKSYIGDAVEWLNDNSGETAQLLTNNRAVAYYSGMVAEYDQVQPRLTRQQVLAATPGDLIVVETSAVIEQLLAQPDITELLEPAITLLDAQEPRMRIYQRIIPD
ncbi:MAG: hypothetical protein F4234_00305 [Gammaproteobacteria bacterium]|nr:hypothetical protein [Gammaproteobacteria bacterium]